MYSQTEELLKKANDILAIEAYDIMADVNENYADHYQTQIPNNFTDNLLAFDDLSYHNLNDDDNLVLKKNNIHRYEKKSQISLLDNKKNKTIKRDFSNISNIKDTNRK